MEKYTVFIAYSLKDNNYTERPNGLKSTHKLFNTSEEAIDAIVADIKEEYDMIAIVALNSMHPRLRHSRTEINM